MIALRLMLYYDSLTFSTAEMSHSMQGCVLGHRMTDASCSSRRSRRRRVKFQFLPSFDELVSSESVRHVVWPAPPSFLV